MLESVLVTVVTFVGDVTGLTGGFNSVAGGSGAAAGAGIAVGVAVPATGGTGIDEGFGAAKAVLVAVLVNQK